jgi:Uma2 family endonuclease
MGKVRARSGNDHGKRSAVPSVKRGATFAGSESATPLAEAAPRIEKGRVYARAGIPVYWIVNVADKRIEVYTNPDATANPPVYTTRTDYAPGTAVPSPSMVSLRDPSR